MNAPPVIAFRTTCSETIGFGHLRRCLTLAHAAARDTRPVFLITADARGAELARSAGFPVELVAPGEPAATLAHVDRLGAACLVTDDYALSAEVLAALHARVPRLLAIDDGAAHRLEVDAVLNAAPHAAALAYEVPAGALRLLGARYALLRPEFRDLPARRARDTVERVLVTLGGANPGGRAGEIMRGLLAAFPEAVLELAAGPLFQGDLPADARLVVHRSPRNMVELMARADLAISAGGQTTYELAACGVPTVALCVAENQRANLAALAAVPTLRIATDDDLVATAVALAADREARQQLVDRGQALFDGRGAERAWDELAGRWFGSPS